jgi:hypothetical protein
MFGLSDGIDHSQFMALVMRIGVVGALIAVTAQFARALSESPHLARTPSADISAQNRAYSVARDGNDRTSFSGMTPQTIAARRDVEPAKRL